MRCCGRTRATNFCPDCGKDLTEVKGHPLGTLLVHIKSSITRLKQDKKRQEGWLKEKPDNEFVQQRLDNTKRNITKWSSWEEAIKEAIKKG